MVVPDQRIKKDPIPETGMGSIVQRQGCRLLYRNGLDLKERALGQIRHLIAGAGGGIGVEHAGVDGVDGGKIVDVGQEDRGLHPVSYTHLVVSTAENLGTNPATPSTTAAKANTLRLMTLFMVTMPTFWL